MCQKHKHSLVCGCCQKDFVGTKYQVSNQKYSGSTPYCSKECRVADNKKNRSKKVVLICGPCPECNKKFESKVDKKYCSQECYHSSEECRARLRQLNLDKKNDVEGNCPQCGDHFVNKASRNQKFCSKICYRTYMADRFDRWVASPENITTPQNFDEFLTKEELPCLVDGCDWTGKSLGAHLNFTHGITAREFKIEAGFNIGTGLVTPEVSKNLSDREHLQGIFDDDFFKEVRLKNLGGNKSNYRSAEAKEHAAKSRAVSLGKTGPKRKCKNCKKPFEQSTIFGVAKFCSPECQHEHHYEKFMEKKYLMNCENCKASFKGNRAQSLRLEKNGVVACSFKCRGELAMKLKKEREGINAE